MPKSTPAITALLELLFNAVTWDGVAENDSTSPFTSYYLSLHEGSPGIGGSQLTNETNYASYARIPIARTAGGWDVGTNTVSNVALAQFPQCTAVGLHPVDYLAIGTAASGAGTVLYQGALNDSLDVNNLIRPQFDPNGIIVAEA